MRCAALLAAVLLLAGCRTEAPEPLLLRGTIEVREVSLVARTGGRVLEGAAAEGALLRAGDPVVRLEAPEMEARRAEAAARVAEEAAALERLRSGPRPEEVSALRAAVEKARAHHGKLKAGPRPEEVKAARADLAAADAELKKAEEAAARKRELFTAAAIGREELETALAERDRLLAVRDDARARTELLVAGTDRQTLAEAAADLAFKEAQLELLEAGSRPEEVAALEARLTASRARLAEIEVALAGTVVRAPEDAVLEALSVRAGDLIAPDTPVARLHAAADVRVAASVPEAEAGRVAAGREATVTVEALPGRTFRGTVRRVASGDDPAWGAGEAADASRAVVLTVEDPEGLLRGGMAAEAALVEPAPR
jgi:multidrug resistance efflux pump